MRLFGFLPVMLFLFSARGQFKTDSLMTDLLRSDTSALVRKLISNPDKYRIQIIYTRIDRDKNNRPYFRNYYFHVNRDFYFYPASTVKLPLSLLSLEKLNRMHRKGVNRDTRMAYDSSFSGQKALAGDSTSSNGYPSIAQFIRKALLISDNDAYNRMYEFVGQQQINRRLDSLGFPDIRIVRQFMSLNEWENRHTNAIRFLDSSGSLLCLQSPAVNTDSFNFPWHQVIGRGYMDGRDSLIHEPKDFSRHNRIPLEDLQQILQRTLFPASFPPQKRFGLHAADYAFLYQYLSQYPSETSFPKYDTAEFYDSYVKYFFQKGGRQIPAHIRVFNKVGWSYGFLTDVSYIADFKNRIEFMLTAVVYAN